MSINFEQAIVDSLPTFSKEGAHASVDPGTSAGYARVRANSAAIANEEEKEFEG